MFIPKDISSKEYSKFWDKGYPEKRYAVNSFDTLYKELLVLVNDESEKSKNTIITKEDNSHVVKGKFNLEKGDTKENFMDYLRLDDDRKAFNKEQIDIILK